MVIVVVFTTQQQVNEMQNTRILQTQPLPIVKSSKKSYLEKLDVFYSPVPPQIVLENRVLFYAELENIGSGSAVAMDVIPQLKYYDENGKLVTIESVCERLDSLKPEQKEEVCFLFTGGSQKVIEEKSKCILKNFLDGNYKSEIGLTLLYKNALGACFKEEISFEIWFYEEDREKIKSCLKLLETAKIDFAEDLRQAGEFESLKRGDEANVLREKMSAELSKKPECTNIEFSPEATTGSFSVSPISENEYQKRVKKSVSYGHLLGVSRDDEVSDSEARK
jgi:hypothetical protein